MNAATLEKKTSPEARKQFSKLDERLREETSDLGHTAQQESFCCGGY